MQPPHAGSRRAPDVTSVDVVVDHGYRPAEIVVPAGVPVRIAFRREDADPCSERVVFSSPRIDRRLAASGTTIVELPGLLQGEVRFTCGMGRYRGRIRVEPAARRRRLGRRSGPLGSPLVMALLAWIGTLPFAAIVAALAADVGSGALATMITFIASVVIGLRAERRAPRPA